MKTPKLSLSTMNAIVRSASKKQNKKRKLNAGQEREQIRIILESIAELNNDRFSEVLDLLLTLGK